MPPANGFSLVCERMERLPHLLRDQLHTPYPDLPPDLAERGVLATGAGSSEAAARLLVHTLQGAGIPAQFQPLSRFYRTPARQPTRQPARQSDRQSDRQPARRPDPAPYLVVFSQGLSPNAGIPLFHRSGFSGLILFTAATPAGQRKAGKTDRAELLETLLREKALLWTYPLENEYTLLPRFIGPVCVQLAVCQFCEALAPGCLGGTDALQAIPAVFQDPVLLPSPPSAWLADLKQGVSFYFTNECAEAAQNLSYKCMETLMVPPPALVDALSYAHGRFQRHADQPTPHWIFTTRHPDEQDLLHRLAPLFERGGGYRTLESPLPAPLALFYYEAFLNALCRELLQKMPIDLIDWPGKGEDDAGYTLHQPGPHSQGDCS